MSSVNPNGPKVNSERMDWEALKKVAESFSPIISRGVDKATLSKIVEMVSGFKIIENLKVKPSSRASQDHKSSNLNQKEFKLKTSLFDGSIDQDQYFRELLPILKDSETLKTLQETFINLENTAKVISSLNLGKLSIPLVNLKELGVLSIFGKALNDLKKAKEEDIKELNKQIQSIREEDDGDLYGAPLTPDQQTRVDALEGKKKAILEQMDQMLKDIEKIDLKKIEKETVSIEDIKKIVSK